MNCIPYAYIHFTENAKNPVNVVIAIYPLHYSGIAIIYPLGEQIQANRGGYPLPHRQETKRPYYCPDATVTAMMHTVLLI